MLFVLMYVHIKISGFPMKRSVCACMCVITRIVFLHNYDYALFEGGKSRYMSASLTLNLRIDGECIVAWNQC